MKRQQRFIYIGKNHPFYFMSSNGMIPESRLLMAQQLSRPLMKKEIVHHIDNNTMNNSLDNLVIMTRQEHSWITKRDRLIRHLDQMKSWKNIVEKDLRTVNKRIKELGLGYYI